MHFLLFWCYCYSHFFSEINSKKHLAHRIYSRLFYDNLEKLWQVLGWENLASTNFGSATLSIKTFKSRKRMKI